MSLQKEVPLTEQLDFKPQGPDKTIFECIHPPKKIGNTLNIAYGGYALAIACKAACLSVPPTYKLYSIMGNYLGPALSDRPLRATVRTIRQTRTFATRQVEVSQTHDNGESRVCLLATADFQVPEPATLLTYSRLPKHDYTSVENCLSQHDRHQQLLRDGKITQTHLDEFTSQFSLRSRLFEMRPVPEGIFAQNLYGIAKTTSHSQDSLPITSRTTAEYIRLRPQNTTFISTANQYSILSFLTDGAISFCPLSFSHLWFDDISAHSSLDFALRVFGDVDVSEWLLWEVGTSVGEGGRTFGESWVWDRSGRAVACMSQMTILRPKKGEGKGKL